MNDRDASRAAAPLEADRRRIAAKHAATNPHDQPVYDADFYRSILRDRTADEASATPQYVPLSLLMRRAKINRANVDDTYFAALCETDDSAQGMMGDRD